MGPPSGRVGVETRADRMISPHVASLALSRRGRGPRTTARRLPLRYLRGGPTQPTTAEKTMDTETATLEKLKIVDERTGHSYDVAIENGTIRGTDLKKIRSGPEDPGLMVYDPAYMNT